MKKIFRSRFFDSHSDILKAAPQTKIQNLKWRAFGIAFSRLWWGCGQAQQARKIPRIGYLANGSYSANSYSREAFQQGLRALGYVEGKNILIEYRYAEGKSERLPELAEELVRLKVDVIVVSGGTRTVLRIKKVTATVPVVFPLASDPVRDGLVDSLARPGGNLTGLSSVSRDLAGKRLELLKETIPTLIRVAVLIDPNDASNVASSKEIEADAKTVGVQLYILEARAANEIESAIRSGVRAKAGAVLVCRRVYSITSASESRISQ